MKYQCTKCPKKDMDSIEATAHFMESGKTHYYTPQMER